MNDELISLIVHRSYFIVIFVIGKVPPPRHNMRKHTGTFASIFMVTATLPDLFYRGERLDPAHADWMIDSTPLLGDVDALRRRMNEEGYLYLPGYLGRERVLGARRVITNRLSKLGVLHPDRDPMDAIPNGKKGGFDGGPLRELFDDPSPIHDVLYDGPMIEFFRAFLNSPVRHYDYTWMRQVRPGPATQVHCDVVYMGRGTHELFTAWTPMGDNNLDLGGLLVLAGSHKFEGLKKSYWQSDVDSFCTNRTPQQDAWARGQNGLLKATAQQLQKTIGGKWVTADYRAGDLVIFSVYTVHGGTDNRSGAFRLSTDTRYQRASDPIDERWIGERPVAHGAAGKRGKVC